MPATPAQFAALSVYFGNAGATAIVSYVDQKIVAQTSNMSSTPAPVVVALYPIRSMDTDFIVSTNQNAEVSYTIETSTAATGAGSNDDEARVDLVINGVIIHSARNRIVATLTAILGLLGISLTSNVQRWVLSGYVPMGSTVNLTSSGTGTKTLISAQEVLQ